MARVALNRMNSKISIARGVVEMYITNLVKALQRSQWQMKQQLPDHIQYLIMYILGLIKSPFLTPRAI